jgi:hypothetical protein
LADGGVPGCGARPFLRPHGGEVDDALLLPAGTRLVHIGPHKTGTSSVQSAFHRARRAAAKHGVHYAGPNRQPLSAAKAATTAHPTRADRPALRPWRELVREVRSATAQRVVISSEWLADAEPLAIQRIVDDLDAARVHVVVTVRPLAGILPSQWQQYVQAGTTMAYEPWLRGVLAESPDVTPTFWRRHRHDELVARWAAVVGVDRVTVVVADDRDHSAVLRAFERLVGLPSGLLVAENDRANRSLTTAEIELVRAMNVALDGHGVDPTLRQTLVLFGAARNLKLRPPDRAEPRIQTPTWADESIAAAARGMVTGLRASGVRVVGDLDQLAAPPARTTTQTDTTASDRRWPEVAALGAMGVLVATGLARGGRGGLATAWAASAPISTSRVRSIVGGRIVGAASARMPLIGRIARKVTGRPGPRSPIHSPGSEVE